jgi:hypothetical protein
MASIYPVVVVDEEEDDEEEPAAWPWLLDDFDFDVDLVLVLVLVLDLDLGWVLEEDVQFELSHISVSVVKQGEHVG